MGDGDGHGGCAVQGYACEATEAELKKYMSYELRGLCPDDWFFVQHLIFVKNCYALPKRRCLARTPQQFIEVGGLDDRVGVQGLGQAAAASTCSPCSPSPCPVPIQLAANACPVAERWMLMQ